MINKNEYTIHDECFSESHKIVLNLKERFSDYAIRQIGKFIVEYQSDFKYKQNPN